jgi:hypothetical protein
VDVTALRARAEQAERDKEALEEKLTLLERRIEVSCCFECKLSDVPGIRRTETAVHSSVIVETAVCTVSV